MHVLVIQEHKISKGIATFASELKSFFVSAVPWGPRLFYFKRKQFVCYRIKRFFHLTAAATFKRRDYLSFHLCYALQIYGTRGVVEISS